VWWDTHDFEDYRDDTEPVAVAVKIAPRKKTWTIPLDRDVYAQIEVLAARRGVRAERLLSGWLRERAKEEAVAE
jgi:hypothetical protein